MIQKVELPELGLVVLLEPQKVAPSLSGSVGPFSVGIWLPIGSRFEKKGEFGLSHLVEHLVFKKKSVTNLVKKLEGKGADLNGFTSHEYTCFQVTCLNEDAEPALEFLGEVLKDLVLPEEEFEREKQVIIQEILSAKDDIEQDFHEFILKNSFPQTGLDRSIAGEVEELRQLRLVEVQSYHRHLYQRGRAVISVAGIFHPTRIRSLINEVFQFRKKIKWSDYGRLWQGYFSHFEGSAVSRALQPGVFIHERNTQHLYLSVLFELDSIFSPERFYAHLLNSWFAQGMASRLFFRLREELGLVYFVNGSVATFLDRGFYLIEASSDPQKMPDVIEVLFQELELLKKQSFSSSWLQKYKTLIRGQTVLASFDPENRMGSLGVQELYFQKPETLSHYLKNYQKITQSHLKQFVKKRLNLSQAGVFLYGSQASKFPPFVQGLLAKAV
ncbi:MAG: insulinase family protein [Bdellovibrionaceae bacterium]|nr:insulinase family protein [Pseudobdellovibrionaceae bacterium]MDW8190827.1 pitrilysin family protein [Pseudobdellovibrionaceae bacterium]